MTAQKRKRCFSSFARVYVYLLCVLCYVLSPVLSPGSDINRLSRVGLVREVRPRALPYIPREYCTPVQNNLVCLVFDSDGRYVHERFESNAPPSCNLRLSFAVRIFYFERRYHSVPTLFLYLDVSSPRVLSLRLSERVMRFRIRRWDYLALIRGCSLCPDTSCVYYDHETSVPPSVPVVTDRSLPVSFDMDDLGAFRTCGGASVRKTSSFCLDDVRKMIRDDLRNSEKLLHDDVRLIFCDYLEHSTAEEKYLLNSHAFLLRLNFGQFIDDLKLSDMKRIVASHGGFKIKSRSKSSDYLKLLKMHDSSVCDTCTKMTIVLKQTPTRRYGIELMDYSNVSSVEHQYSKDSYLFKSIGVSQLSKLFALTLEQYKFIARVHGELGLNVREGLSSYKKVFEMHGDCVKCRDFAAVWQRPVSGSLDALKMESQLASLRKDVEMDVDETEDPATPFPFPPHDVTSNWLPAAKGFADSLSPENIEEIGCAVCAQLFLRSSRVNISTLDLDPLLQWERTCTRIQRYSLDDDIKEIPGPVLVPGLEFACPNCAAGLRRGVVPSQALARGLWLGEVPDQLKHLSFAEKLVISRVRYNRCVAHITVNGVGNRRMRGNAVLLQNPTLEIYPKLPPRMDTLDEVLAITFTGPVSYTPEDIRRTPLLVRRNVIADALSFLKLNHVDYDDLIIDQDALNEYPDNDCPVRIKFNKSEIINDTPETTSLHNTEGHIGSTSGPAPFAVHGLTGKELGDYNSNQIKAAAISHMVSDGCHLEIHHSSDKQSIFSNPQLYPKIFPWLFPYGFGGIGSRGTTYVGSEAAHRKWMLMYHDRRFQTDPYFPLVALNHAQIKESSQGGRVFAKRKYFPSIAKDVLNIDPFTLDEVSHRLQHSKGRVVPQNESEKHCFDVYRNLDHIAKEVTGSLTSKKHRRTEAWSLLRYRGAPTWFITFAPADIYHPLSIYYASQEIEFKPKIEIKSETRKLIADNPVAAARFFDFMVKVFIKHVLGVDSDHPGIFGETDAYYGTVEEQGRLTLHLHLLLWIKGALSPQQIRDKLGDPMSQFQKELIEYLEACHRGELFDTTCVEMQKNKDDIKSSGNDRHEGSNDATMESEPQKRSDLFDSNDSMPVSPPSVVEDGSCELASWWAFFKRRVNEIVFKSNVHNCFARWSTCRIKGKGVCAARMPRDVVGSTRIDPDTGSIQMKHREPWLNTFNAPLSFLMACNTDVTSLLSGTAVKAVIAYITDYTTKPKLKTYAVFQTLKATIMKNGDLLNGVGSSEDRASLLLKRMVNQLTAKMEIGAPLACLFLLGQKDWYSNYEFRPFFWSKYHKFVLSDGPISETRDGEETVQIVKDADDKLVPVSGVDDYIYRPLCYESLNLYDWARRAGKRPSRKKRFKTNDVSLHSNEDDPQEDDVDCAIIESEDDVECCDDRENPLDENTDTDLPEPNEKTSRSIGKSNVSKKHEFLPQHPQYLTHSVSVSPDKQTLVPNFLGPNIPRRDKGDQDEYFSAMLTLFKPWRAPCDLKIGLTWEEAFRIGEKSFTPRQREIMNNFHLQYECYDARDDFSRTRKQQVANLPLSFNSTNLINEEILQQQISEDALYENCFPEEMFQTEPDEWGAKYTLRHSRMVVMEKLLQVIGWYSKLKASCAFSIDFPSITPQGTQYWKELVSATNLQIISNRRAANPPTNGSGFGERNPNDSSSWYEGPGWARVVTGFLKSTFQSNDSAHDKIVSDIIEEKTYNEEQKRAFKIVANHVAQGGDDQLRMILTGMAGTGKSQVIQGIVKLFEKRGERARLLLVAPTGAAASVIGGSTYHSALGINTGFVGDDKQSFSYGGSDENTKIVALRSQYIGTDYLVLDEFSMIGVRALYQISERCCKIFNVYDKPFGGLKVIFAGDFAQLAPVLALPLYNRKVGTKLRAGMTAGDQMDTIGKSLWHQFTTVVVLRQNMRQRKATPEDAKLRTALENMRYGTCTAPDCIFLDSLCIDDVESDPRFLDPRFRNVSIITSRNYNRDKINEMGAKRFASDTNQSLTLFCSTDRPCVERAIRKSASAKKSLNSQMSESQQKVVWSLPPDMTSHHPGQLPLCAGMPVMIKRNQATECSITNGAEATVYGWEEDTGSHGQPVLRVLFVKLSQPFNEPDFEGLPPGVVPILAQDIKITCRLQNDHEFSINREQVPVLLNFAMTDFSAQGRTRPQNPVHITGCDSPNSYYVCLSRSSSAKDTILIGKINRKYITQHVSAELRHEFRTLEILDELTRVCYEGLISQVLPFESRYDAVNTYRDHFNGNTPCPSHVHSALAWSVDDPLDKNEVWKVKWKVVESKKNTKNKTSTTDEKTERTAEDVKHLTCSPNHSFQESIVTKPIVPLTSSAGVPTCSTSDKMEVDLPLSGLYPPHDTRRIAQLGDVAVDRRDNITCVQQESRTTLPMGLRWSNNSCAYDSLLTVLYNSYLAFQSTWGMMCQSESQTENAPHALAELSRDFGMVSSLSCSLEAVREKMNCLLRLSNSSVIPPMGHFASVSDIFQILCTYQFPLIAKVYCCINCGYEKHTTQQKVCSSILSLSDHKWAVFQASRSGLPVLTRSTTSDWLQLFMTCKTLTTRVCPSTGCDQTLVIANIVRDAPPLLLFDLQQLSASIKMSTFVHMKRSDQTRITYKLSGVIYFGNAHFVCRFIDVHNNVWFHDGLWQTTACRLEGRLRDLPQKQMWSVGQAANRKRAYAAVYTRS